MSQEFGAIDFENEVVVHDADFSALHELDFALCPLRLYANADHIPRFYLSSGGEVADEERHTFHVGRTFRWWVESLADKSGSAVLPLELLGIVP